MQQAELIEIGILSKEAVENFKKYGTTEPTERDIKICEVRQYNLKLLAEQRAKREYWYKVKEARIYNLKLKAEQEAREPKALSYELREPRSVSEIIDRINRNSTI